ncbi:hypothetical protein JKF63_05413 [Porcisia hertigi]|uniref:Uncharacterized protein n=1 Tax=Porcisia hertigi TaxID=2761500 RepID=A0A836LDL4_9TRYP|nr:hypothetical protein JKF63_05413 [Porcisia hertigi]
MAAIQRVLAEHNVSDARFILELPPADAAAAATAAVASRFGAVREACDTDKVSPITEKLDSSASNTGEQSTRTALLREIQATPAAAPLRSPEHQLPPPRARSPSTRNRSPVSQNPQSLYQRDMPLDFTKPPNSPALLDSTVDVLDSTARPATDAAAGGESVQQVASTAIAPRERPNATPTQPSTQLRQASSGRPDNTATPVDAAEALMGDAATEVRRMSERVAHEVAMAEAQAKRKEILQSFLGRSAILDYRRQREAKQAAQPSTLSSSGISPLAAPRKAPVATTTTTMSSPGRGGTSMLPKKPSARTISADTAGLSGSVANTFSSASLPPSLPEPQQPQRRGVVRLTSPAPNTSVDSSGIGIRGSVLLDSSSLPSLVSAKKSAVPGKTPVFSILNRDGSRLLDQGGAVATPRTPLAGAPSSGATSATTAGTAANGGAVTDANQLSSDSSSNNSIAHSRHSRLSSVSLLADDRAPPSPVHEPLVGSAAKEEASRTRSILVSTKLRAATPKSHPLESASGKGIIGEALPKLWTEQSRDNARIAAQLQSQSGLSRSTEMLDPPQRPVTAGTIPMGNPQARAANAPSSVSSLRLSPGPSTSSTLTASSRPSLRAMLQEQQQLQEESRRGIENHKQLIQAITSAQGLPFSTSSQSNAPATPKESSTSVAAAEPAERVAAARLGPGTETPARRSPLGHSISASTASNTAGIQVVKFTLPDEQGARQAAVQQLCHSTAGTQHLDSKARYRALLDEQQNEIAAQEEKVQGYKELLTRAVDFNIKYQQQQQQQQKQKPS